MQRLSREEVKKKSPLGDVIAAWTGHLDIGSAHPTSVHSLLLMKECHGFNPVVFCWGESSGNKIKNYIIFKGRYNFWIPGQDSGCMAISTLNKLSLASSKAPANYFHKLFPIRKNLNDEQIQELDAFWNNTVANCWKFVRKRIGIYDI